jgi:hypothetical protein
MVGRSWREKTVRRVRNPEGGTDRVRQARDLVDLHDLTRCRGTNLMRGTAKAAASVAVA